MGAREGDVGRVKFEQKREGKRRWREHERELIILFSLW